MTNTIHYGLTSQENYVRHNGNILAEVRNAVADVPPWEYAKLFASAPEMGRILEEIADEYEAKLPKSLIHDIRELLKAAGAAP